MSYEEDQKEPKVSKAAVSEKVDPAKERLVNKLLGAGNAVPSPIKVEKKAEKFGMSKTSGKPLYRK